MEETSNKDNKDNKEDEINLINFLRNVLLLLKNNVKVLLTILILFNIAFLLFYFVIAKPKYESNLYLNTKILSIEDIGPIIESLDNLMDEDNYKELSKKLNISPKQASYLSEITIGLNNKQDYIETEDATLNYDKYVVHLTVFDPKILKNIGTKIIKYINNNPYHEELSNITRNNLINQKKKLKHEINSLDTLKNTMEYFYNGNRSQTNILFTDPSSISKSIIDINAKLNEVERKLRLNLNVRLLRDFNQVKKPYNKGVLMYLVLAVAGSFILTILLTVIFSIISTLKKL